MFKTQKQPSKSKIQRRVDRLPTADLMGWAEQAIYGIGRSLSDWKRHGNKESLNEALEGSEALTAVVTAIRDRTARDF